MRREREVFLWFYLLSPQTIFLCPATATKFCVAVKVVDVQLIWLSIITTVTTATDYSYLLPNLGGDRRNLSFGQKILCQCFLHDCLGYNEVLRRSKLLNEQLI